MARESGFTLLEVLVAFTIAALALTGLFQSSRTGLNNAAIAARTLDATALAQSLLAAAQRGEPFAPGTQSGTGSGDFSWRTSVTPAGSRPDANLYRIDISVEWPGGAHRRSVTLTGYRIAGGRDG